MAYNKKAHDEVYGQDKRPPSFGRIQWKGTDVCMDVHCVCGEHCHIDGEFFYAYQCPSCGRVFAVGEVVTMIEVTKEQQEALNLHPWIGDAGDDNGEIVEK